MLSTPTAPVRAPRQPSPATLQRLALQQFAAVRITGTLTTDARLVRSSQAQPHVFLMLELEQPQGLPYLAQMDLGTDVADHLQAQAELHHLRRGALVSVAGTGLEMRADHAHAALRIVHAHGLVIPLDLIDPINPPEGQPHVD